MDSVVFVVVCMILGALALVLMYMAARAGAYDGMKDFEDSKRGGRK